MTTPEQEAGSGRGSTLRRKTVLSFAGLAVMPLVLGLGVLFLVARHDVGKLQGDALTKDAVLLAEQIRTRIDRDGQFVRALAGAPEVREYLAGRGPYPQKVVGMARQFLLGLHQVELLPLNGGMDGGPGPALLTVSWGEDRTLEYTAEVLDAGGRAVGACTALFRLEGLSRVFQWVERTEHGQAVLFDEQGTVLAGPPGVPVPPVRPPGERWTSFEAGGETHFAGLTPVSPGGGDITKDWFVAVVQPASRVYRSFYFVAAQVALLLVAFGAMVTVLAYKTADRFLNPIMQIRSGAEIISRINLGHRIKIETGDELEDLAESFNHMAENLAGAYDELGERVRETTRTLQEERNRLATVLRTMVDGVVVTNESGDVTLMNPRARLVLDSGPSSGIGGPLGRILPRERLEFHLKRLRQRWDVGHEAVEDAVFPLRGGGLLRGSMTVVPGPGGERAGFLFVFRDHGALQSDQRRPEDVVRQLPELLRGPAATAASLAETLERHPEMPAEKRTAFVAALHQEIGRLSERLGVAEEAAAATEGTRWRGIPSDPRELVEEAVAAVPGVFARIEVPEGPMPPVLVEPFSWVAAMASVLRWLAGASSGWVPLGAALKVEDDTVVTSFEVEGAGNVGLEELDELPVCPEGEDPLGLKEAVHRNRGELWTRRSGDLLEVRLGLMRAPVGPDLLHETGIADQQPEFYDFDLFLPRPSVEPRETLKAPLESLEYVVFDSETTGLHPSKGDEMVSLSGIRVRRGKLQHSDTFHTLINPGMRIPRESIQFHGITDDMVTDAPNAVQVFHDFAEYIGDAVLVAHNAAFDKKFLDIAANRAERPLLDNPILDTLFLSYGIHKEFTGHNLDSIAQRLGIEVEGRHTSMGDAQATAAIFLRLIPLLASRGIHTLGDAKTFCDRMLLLRWQSSRF